MQFDAPRFEGDIVQTPQFSQGTVDRRVEGLTALQGDLPVQAARIVIGTIGERDHGPAALDPKLVQAPEKVAVDRHVFGDLRGDFGSRPASCDFQRGDTDRRNAHQSHHRNEDQTNRDSQHDHPPGQTTTARLLQDAYRYGGFQVLIFYKYFQIWYLIDLDLQHYSICIIFISQNIESNLS
ncbi:hypothetical protein MKK65_15765 [Methylobacterium sp. J-001]|uniref:hypothetical protein n=1 Tax=Methylobacterium sp. J-001 TaxID=2836609 RepID=UPI001FB8D307|nr:hypothetical protein [Methylobacterium sp. J-001]MCJ2118005.1 hypothetical protein [Methylobacterium sp. J-001]